MSETEKTVGEKIVRADFNPNGNTLVNSFKTNVAAIIDQVDAIRDMDPRLAALAITHLEIAAMFAVKLATTQK